MSEGGNGGVWQDGQARVDKGGNPMTKAREFDLEERMVDFAVRIIKVSESLPDTRAGNHLGGQLLHSGTSPASNYAEAQSAGITERLRA